MVKKEETKLRQVVMLPIDKIRVSRWNPRKIDPKDPATQRLAESMAGPSGLIQPISVRLDPKEKGYWELLAGSRRFAAAKLLKWAEIAAEEHECDDQTAVSIIVIENLQRENLTPLEEAAGLKVLLERGEDHATIAKHIGWPLSRVARRAALVRLIPDWQSLITNKFSDWTAGHMELIARLPEEQQRALAARVKKREVHLRHETVPQLEKSLFEFLRPLSSAPWKLDDTSLVPKVGPCNTCPKRSSVSPELFFDDGELPAKIKSADRCLHGTCWGEKMRAFIDRRIKELKTEHKDLITVYRRSAEWSERQAAEKIAESKDMAFMGIDEWDGVELSKKGIPGAKPAVVIAGGGIGELCYVREKRSGGASSRSGSSAGRKEGGGSSLAVREARLACKRFNWICDKLGEKITAAEGTDIFTGRTIEEQRGMVYGVLMSLEPEMDIASLGGPKGTGIVKDDRVILGGDAVLKQFDDAIDSVSAGAEDAVLCEIWRMECRVRLAKYVLEQRRGDQKRPEEYRIRIINRVCMITRLATYDSLEEAAAAEFPEPKSWAKERGDNGKKSNPEIDAKKKPSGHRKGKGWGASAGR